MSKLLTIAKKLLYLPKPFFLATGGEIISELGILGVPMVGGMLIDLLIKGQMNSLFYWLIGALVLCHMLDSLGNRVFRTTKEYLLTKIKNLITHNTYQQLYKIDYSTIQTVGTGKILTRVNNGIQAEVSILSSISGGILSTLVRGTLIIGFFFFTMPRFNAVVLVIGITSYFVNSFFFKKTNRLGKQLNKISERAGKISTKIAMEQLVIRVNNKQEKELEKLSEALKDEPMVCKNLDFFYGISYDIVFQLVMVLQAAVYVIIGRAVIKGTSSIGHLTVLVSYLNYLWRPISTFMNESQTLRKNLVKYDKLQTFLNTPNQIKDGADHLRLEDGHIQCDHLTFSYPKNAQPVFTDFSISFTPYKTTALVGHSGSGKSTLVKLLLRLYDPASGEISIDDQPLTSLQLNSYYEHVGYLSQEPAIFDGTIRENLEYAFATERQQTVIANDSEAISKNNKIASSSLTAFDFSSQGPNDTEAKMHAALEKAHIADLVKSLPKGLDTQLGEKGIKLSGGEKQRLALARIFLKNPKILVLDEPTSALDSISEQAITQAMKSITKDRTVIIIAHRLQTVMHADNIIVLEKGKIIQQGKHDQLVKQEGTYKTLVNLQKGTIDE